MSNTITTPPTGPTLDGVAAATGPRERTVMRVAGGALLACALLLLSLNPVEGPPVETVTGPQALAHFAESASTRTVLGYLAALLGVLWLVALAAVRQVGVRRSPGGIWGDVFFGAGLLVAGNSWLMAAVNGIPAAVDLDTATPGSALAWYQLEVLASSYGNVAVVGQAVLVAALGMLGLRTAALHRPVAWFLVAVASCPVVSLATEAAGLAGVAQGFFYAALFGFVIGVGVAGGSLLVRARKAG